MTPPRSLPAVPADAPTSRWAPYLALAALLLAVPVAALAPELGLIGLITGLTAAGVLALRASWHAAAPSAAPAAMPIAAPLVGVLPNTVSPVAAWPLLPIGDPVVQDSAPDDELTALLHELHRSCATDVERAVTDGRTDLARELADVFTDEALFLITTGGTAAGGTRPSHAPPEDPMRATLKNLIRRFDRHTLEMFNAGPHAHRRPTSVRRS